MHKIKKYANRKMYDTTDKRYVSMDRLAELIKAGEEVSIIDNRTGEDLTASVVSQLLGRDNRGSAKAVPSGMLFDLLRRGGDTLTDYAKRYSSLWQHAVTLAEDEVDKLVGGLVKNKELSDSEGSRLKKEITGYTDALKSWVGERVDRRLNEALNAMNLPSRGQVDVLTDKIDALTREVARLKAGLAEMPADEKSRVS